MAALRVTASVTRSHFNVADPDAVLSGVSQANIAVSDTLAVAVDGASVLRYHTTVTRR
jgi:hypothetical protein